MISIVKKNKKKEDKANDNDFFTNLLIINCTLVACYFQDGFGLSSG